MIIGLEVPRYWVMTYVGLSFVEPIPVRAFFDKSTDPYPEWIDAPIVLRASAPVPSGKQLIKKG